MYFHHNTHPRSMRERLQHPPKHNPDQHMRLVARSALSDHRPAGGEQPAAHGQRDRRGALAPPPGARSRPGDRLVSPHGAALVGSSRSGAEQAAAGGLREERERRKPPASTTALARILCAALRAAPGAAVRGRSEDTSSSDRKSRPAPVPAACARWSRPAGSRLQGRCPSL